MLIKTVENFMNIKKTLAWAITGSLLLVSAVSAEVPKGDKNAGKTLANRLARSVDDGPSSTFFNVNSWKIQMENQGFFAWNGTCLLYTSPSPRDATLSRMPSSA